MSFVSSFPEKVDERYFFSDIGLREKSIMDTFNKLISEGKINDAINYKNQFSNLSSYSAETYNYIEQKILTTETYLKGHKKICPFFYDVNEPDGITAGQFWFSN